MRVNVSYIQQGQPTVTETLTVTATLIVAATVIQTSSENLTVTVTDS